MIIRFNQAKAATGFMNRQMVPTGSLDLTKIANYKTSDYIFKTDIVKQKCKNHGVFVVIDYSGSMAGSGKIQGAVLQAIKIAYFCRQARIPFEIFAFTSQSVSDKGVTQSRENAKIEAEGVFDAASDPNTIQLIQLLHSNVGTEENFNQACKNLLAAVVVVDTYGSPFPGVPMGGTPLINALDSLGQYALEFKKRHRIENFNFMVLTDGQTEHFHMTERTRANSDRDGKTYTSSGQNQFGGYGHAITWRNTRLGIEATKGNGEYCTPTEELFFMYGFLRRLLNGKVYWLNIDDSLNHRFITDFAKEHGQHANEGKPKKDVRELTENWSEQLQKNGFVEIRDIMNCDAIFLTSANFGLHNLTSGAKDATAQVVKKMRSKSVMNLLSQTIGDAVARAELKENVKL